MSRDIAESTRAKLINQIEQALDAAIDEAAKLPPDDIEGFLLAKACEDIHVAACHSHEDLLDELKETPHEAP